MKIGSKIVVLFVVGFMLMLVNSLWGNAVEPVVGTNLAINNVNGGNADWAAMHIFQTNQGLAKFVSIIGFIGLGLFMFVPWDKLKNKTPVALLVLAVLYIGGCKPYDAPEYKEVKTSETAFVIPLEGNTGDQAKFDSAKYLDEKKVSAKRIQIPHRWSQSGRMWFDGIYLPTVQLITVDRSPVTREWESNNNKNTDAIWVESADSVGFSMGWTVTGYIKEENASTFLYWYPAGSLATVMDKEVRARIQQVSANFSAGVKLDLLREKKAELAKAVIEDVIPFFEKRGITITTVGMFGGMTYENPKIQESIDLTFVNQQEKVNAASLLEAQKDKNTRIKSEAEAVAEAAKTKAKGEADGNLFKLTAEADGIKAINKAIAEANNNPQLVQLKSIDVERLRVEKWDGKFPATVVGNGANSWIGLQPTNIPVASPVQTK
jgi:hypothetical protein